MATFTIQPDIGAKNAKKPRIIKADFGDSYVQRTGDGIQYNPDKWSLTFTRVSTTIDTIETWFDTNNAHYTSFDWTPPRGSAGKYICETYDREIIAPNTDKLTCVFVESFV